MRVAVRARLVGVEHGDLPVGAGGCGGGVEPGDGVAGVLQVQGVDVVGNVGPRGGRAGGEDRGDVVTPLDRGVGGDVGDRDPALGVAVEGDLLPRLDTGLAHGGDDAALHGRGRATHGLEVGEQVLRLAVAGGPVRGAGDIDDPGDSAVGMLDPLDGDDPGLLVALPQGVLRGLHLLAVGDGLGDALRGLGLLALAGHTGIHGAGEPEGVLGGGRQHGRSGAADGGDRDAALGAVDPCPDRGGVRAQDHGDALHGREARGVDGLCPDGDLPGQALLRPGVETLGDLLEVGLDRGGLPPGLGVLEPARQQDDPDEVLLDPLLGGRVTEQELEDLDGGLPVLVVLHQLIEQPARRR